MDLTRLTPTAIVRAYDRLGARLDHRNWFHPGGPLGRPFGCPLGVLAVDAKPDLATTGRALDGRAVADALGLEPDIVACFSGGFADGCAGSDRDWRDWPGSQFAEAFRAGFRLAKELRRLRPNLFDPVAAPAPANGQSRTRLLDD